MSTIVALFNEKSSAESARQQLIREGLRANEIRIEDGRTTNLSSRLTSLKQIGMPEQHGEAYCEGLRRGGALVTAHLDDNAKTVKVQEIMQDAGAVDVDRRMEAWRKTGWDHFDANAKPFSETEAERERMQFADTAGRTAGAFTIPVIEEEMQVDKRDVETGGVRVREHITERPVEEKIRLRDETVHVDRQRVDRPVSASDMNSMKDQTIEVTERHEEPVVKKQARVKEEVRISKGQKERTESVRDTLKKTDVSVEKMDSTSGRTNMDRTADRRK